MSALLTRATALDAADPLAEFRIRFVGSDDDRIIYLDGNSLGRPLRSVRARLATFVDERWGERLIRCWDEQWLAEPTRLGDALAAAALGAGPGQTTVADSTTVLLYKLVRAAVSARPGRRELVIDRDEFPTDRFVLEAVAAECGLTVRWMEVDPAAGVTPALVRASTGPDTALVVVSHVSFRSAVLADVPAITAAVHNAGALVLWDLCHSAGVVPTELDAWAVDLAVGCTYKYLNGGPGAPAFAYVARPLQDDLRQPIWGWMGTTDPFAMGEGYEPAPGIRRLLSGTPPILSMLPVSEMVDLVAEAGRAAVREKSVALTDFAVELADDLLAPLGVTVASPRDSSRRGSHVLLAHPRFREVTARLWERDVIAHFQPPDGLRVGLSPLSTSFAELASGMAAVREELCGG